MTPTPAWYEADSDDSDRNVTDDITASTPQEPRGAILPACEPARGFSDADLLRKRTAALNRTSAENERLRAEVERLQRMERGQTKAAQTAWRNADKFRAERDALRAGVEAMADAGVTTALIRAVLARSQAPQPPAEQEGRFWLDFDGEGEPTVWAGDPARPTAVLRRCEISGDDTTRDELLCRIAPSVRPAAADDECASCGHRHSPNLGGICIGCPCTEGGWSK